MLQGMTGAPPLPMLPHLRGQNPSSRQVPSYLGSAPAPGPVSSLEQLPPVVDHCVGAGAMGQGRTRGPRVMPTCLLGGPALPSAPSPLAAQPSFLSRLSLGAAVWSWGPCSPGGGRARLVASRFRPQGTPPTDEAPGVAGAGCQNLTGSGRPLPGTGSGGRTGPGWGLLASRGNLRPG